jgi:hypothetical protein
MLIDMGGVMSGGSVVGVFDLTVLDGQDLSEDVADGNPCSVVLSITSDGDIDASVADESPSLTGKGWWTPIGSAPGTGYYVRISYTSGTNQYSSGSGLGSWLELSSTRTWTFLKAAEGSGDPDSTNGVYLVEFSDDGGSSVSDSFTLDDVTLTEAAA